MKHGLNITSYWLKHVKPRRQPQRAGSFPTCWKPRPGPLSVGLLRRAASDQGRGSSAGGTGTTPASVAVEENEVNPMDMLEVQMGDTFHMEKEDFDKIGDKDVELAKGQIDTVDVDINANTVQITPLSDYDKPVCINNPD